MFTRRYAIIICLRVDQIGECKIENSLADGHIFRTVIFQLYMAISIIDENECPPKRG